MPGPRRRSQPVLPVVKAPAIGPGCGGRAIAPFDPGIVYHEPSPLRGAADLSGSSGRGRDAQHTSGGLPDARIRPPRTPWLSHLALVGLQPGRADLEPAEGPMLAQAP
jgi:hypothetical protein